MELLLILQEWRLAAPEWVGALVALFSEFSLNAGPVLLVALYLGADKRFGHLAFFTFACSYWVNSTTKLAACVYRPWVLNPAIHPHPGSVAGATGYSFPSGHTSTAAAAFGSVALRWRGRRTVVAACAAMIALTAFSRMFLGCHTLADVAVAVVESLLVLAACSRLYRLIESRPGCDGAVVALTLAATVASVAFVELKGYPTDFAPDGSLLVDPAQMKPDFYTSAGFMVGWALAWYLERRFVGFSCEGPAGPRIARTVAGLAVFGLFHLIVMKAAVAGLDPCLGHFLRSSVTTIITVFVFPAVWQTCARLPRR